MSDSNDRVIGQIEGMIKLILENNNRILDNQNKADISRKQLHESMEALRAEIADYKRRLESAEKRLDAIEKPVAELKKWRERVVGAVMLISGFAALVGGGLAASWHKILEVFR